jgi:sterol desaturase/sphingolipid hydroxylase (fatty acid hydroxylase superfamily)
MLLLGLVFAAVAAEVLIAWRLRRGLYEWRDSELSLGLAAGWAVSGAVGGLLSVLAIEFGYRHRLLDLGAFAAAPILVIILADLFYYAWHRLSHRWRWLWASHFPHHTAKRLNILASMRQGWTDVISGTWLSWIGLGFLGFSPIQTAPYFGLLLVWQALVHNEWTPKLGPLEWLFVTPSHHRVHHSLDKAHIDRNFGGVFIVWDRLFGTFSAEGPSVIHDFGMAGFDSDASNPVEIATREWREMLAPRRAPASEPPRLVD